MQSGPEPQPHLDQMQVTVAVAMPRRMDSVCPPLTRQTEESTDTRRRREHEPVSVPELCLGLMEVRGMGTADWSDLCSTSQEF